MLQFRRPGLEEAEAFAALHVQCWRESYVDFLPLELMASFDAATRLPLWQAALAEPVRFVQGAYDGGRPVGFIISGAADEAHVAQQDGHLAALYVAASHKRLGIGRRLLAAAARDWAGQGGKSLTIGVLAANAPARAFYEGQGARLVKQGHYVWDGHNLPDCLYLLEDLANFAKD